MKEMKIIKFKIEKPLRRSFTLFFTIFFLTVFSLLTMQVLRFSAETSSTLEQVYLFKQLFFLAESGEEFAKIILKNRSSDLDEVVLNDKDFKIVLEFQYKKNNIVLIDIFVSHEIERIRYHKQIYRKVE